MEKKKKMDGEYIVENKLFNFQWASSLVLSCIPREWNDEEKVVVEKVFGKKCVTDHEEAIKYINTKSIENKTPLGMDIDEYLNDKEHVITDPYVKTQLEKAYFENKFYGPEPVDATEENVEIIKEYVEGKNK